MNVLTPETQVSMTAVNKRKAILPLKYGRFMQFGYFLLDKWCEGMDRATVEANTTKFLDLLRVYNTVEEQTELYQLFLNNADGMMRDLKREVVLPLKYRRLNTNSNPTNNTRFQPLGWGVADATNLMITGDQWTHIVIVINGQVQNAYINGTLIQTTNFTNTIIYTKTLYFSLCSNCNGSNQRGTMYHDEYRIYDGLLNSTDVTNIYNWAS